MQLSDGKAQESEQGKCLRSFDFQDPLETEL
jgi:hypothetical protein